MNKNLEQVKEFHEMFEHPIGIDENHVEPLKVRQLRIKLLFEELEELATASDVKITFLDLCEGHANKTYAKIEGEPETWVDGDNVDKVEELDAIADIQYVLNGKILTSGLHGLIEEANDLVHANNMTKAHRDMDHLMDTVIKKQMEGYYHKVKDGLYLLYNSDHKLTKPWNHKKVSFKNLFKKDLEI